MFWGYQKYQVGTGCGFFRWIGENEQYKGRHRRKQKQQGLGRYGRHGRHERPSISIDITVIIIVVI